MKRFVATITAAALVLMLVISMTASAGEKQRKNEKKPKKHPKPTASPTTDPTEPPPPVEVPACADMRVATPSYVFNEVAGSGLLTLDVEVAAPSCSNIDYRLVVLDGVEEDAAILTETSVTGNGVARAGLSGDPGSYGFVSYVIDVPDDDTEICIYSESLSDGTLLDRAPDEACLYIGPGNGNGGRPYN